jgi:hypothetical protein
MDEKITCDDVLQYLHLFTLAPPFLLERMAKKNSNLVSKFKSKIESTINNMSDGELNKLNIILNMDIGDLQALMEEAYRKTNKKQFKILANPKYKDFIKLNLNELRKLI